MMKSAHPDVALWSYERPSRGYFGYHLRARSHAVRRRLHQKLTSLTLTEPLLLRFGAQLDDPVTAGWARTDYTYLSLARGDVPVKAEGVQLAIPEESWPLLLSLLEDVEVQAEGSVNVVTPSAHVPLWVWWDAE
jgi:hypothetical protein